MHIHRRVYMTPGTEPSLQAEILLSCFTLCAWFMLCAEASNIRKKKKTHTHFFIIEAYNKMCTHIFDSI